LTFNVLRAATDVIVPVETGYFALHGLSRQLETLTILCKRCKQHVDVKVLASMYDIRTRIAREILGELREHFADKMFKTIVSFNTKIKEASSFGQPISEYDPSSKGHRDFDALAQEVLGLEVRQQHHDFVNSLAEQLESISATADELLQAAKPPMEVMLPLQAEQPATELPADEFSIDQARAQEPEIEILETPEPLKTAVKPLRDKLSDYYGVSQMNDAVVFVTLYPRASSVQIAGDFNNWQPEYTKMQKVGDSGIWQTQMDLSPGRYRYRLVVDGQWQQDPYNEMTELNPFGGLNSIVEVK